MLACGFSCLGSQPCAFTYLPHRKAAARAAKQAYRQPLRPLGQRRLAGQLAWPFLLHPAICLLWRARGNASAPFASTLCGLGLVVVDEVVDAGLIPGQAPLARKALAGEAQLLLVGDPRPGLGSRTRGHSLCALDQAGCNAWAFCGGAAITLTHQPTANQGADRRRCQSVRQRGSPAVLDHLEQAGSQRTTSPGCAARPPGCRLTQGAHCEPAREGAGAIRAQGLF